MQRNNEFFKQVDCDITIFESYSNEINDIFSSYLETLTSVITIYEVLTGQFPIAIANEIRAIFTHLARVSCTELSEEHRKENVKQAQRHMKRAILDGYKYSCLAYFDNYNHFLKEYANIDLSLIDNGEFILKTSQLFDQAKKSLIKAKKIETNPGNTEDQLYENYEEAYRYFSELYLYVNDNIEKANRLILRQHENIKKKKISDFVLWIVTILSLIFGILGWMK